VDRGAPETGDVVWVKPPPEGMCVNFDVVYGPRGITVTGRPGARSMGTTLVGKVELENGETVFITSVVRTMEEPLRANVERLRSGRILDAAGNPIEKTGIVAFGTEPNPGANDGTEVGTVIDVTRSDPAEKDRLAALAANPPRPQTPDATPRHADAERVGEVRDGQSGALLDQGERLPLAWPESERSTDPQARACDVLTRRMLLSMQGARMG
jgi:hypothetical protein